MKAIARVAAAAMMIVLALRPRTGSREDVVFGSRAERRRAPIVRFIVKHPLATLAALGSVVMLSGAAVMVSGVVPIKASSGHWRITAILLDFAKQRSVATYSLGIHTPPLDDFPLVLRGAAHYANGCESCHGGPEGQIPPVMRAMTPPPPALVSTVSRYTPQKLFSIVKHGIKFTGMPAWPVANRDDEVWAVVAFLRRLPQLTPGAYRQLAYGDRDVMLDDPASPPLAGASVPPNAARAICSRCHGIDGTGRDGGAFPSLAGQQGDYLYASLRAFADERRFSGIMIAIAAALSEDSMREVAEYYSSLPPRTVGAPGESESSRRGAAIAARGVAERGIPACLECHRAGDGERNPLYPHLAGQHRSYLALQLQLLQRRQRGGSPHVNLMHAFVDRLRPDDIDALSHYFASLSR